MGENYDSLNLTIKEEKGGYIAEANSTTLPNSVSETFRMPFSEEEIDEIVENFKKTYEETYIIGEQKLIDFGKKIFEALFTGSIKTLYQQSLENAREKTGLTIRLAVEPLRLAHLPWELLHDGTSFLATSTKTPLIRYAQVGKKKDVPKGSYPLRILFVAARPLGSRPLNLGGQLRVLYREMGKLIQDGSVELCCLTGKEIEQNNLMAMIKKGDRKGGFDVLHISGHGKFFHGLERGFLELEDGEGAAFPLAIETLGAWLTDSSIQLVYLDACETAMGSKTEPLSTIRHTLFGTGVRAVLAMQFSIGVEVATRFSRAFYSQLTKGFPLQYAVSFARSQIVHPQLGYDTIDWAIPVLSMREGKILELRGEKKPQRKGYRELPEKRLFIGRKDQLDEVADALIDSEVRLTLVHGFGGIGKTALARQLVEDMRSYYEDICWIEAREHLSFDEIIAEINKMLLYDGVGISEEGFARYSPEGKCKVVAEQLDKRRFLLILDRFEYVEKDAFVRNLLREIDKRTRTKVLITTRVSRDLTTNQHSFPLGKLKERDAFLLMRRLARQRNINRVLKADEASLRRINEKLDGHPKAIEVVIPHFKDKSMEVIMKNLPTVLAADITSVLDWTYNLLDIAAKQVLRRISVYTEAVSYEALQAVNQRDIFQILNQLREKCLLEYDEKLELYSLHSLVRDFAYNKLKEKKKINKLAGDFYDHQVKTTKNVWDYIEARRYYYKAGEYEKAAEITDLIFPNLERWGYWNLSRDLLKESIDSSRRERKMRFLHNLGIIEQLQGNYEEAKKLYEESLKIKKELGDKQGIASSLYHLGIIQQLQGNYEEAKKLYEESLKISEELSDKEGISKILHELGIIQQLQGNYEEAKKLYEESLKIKKELGDKRGIALSLHQLGIIQQHQGNYEEAKKLYEESLKIKKELGDKQGIALSLHQLGIIQQHQGNYEEAKKLYEESLKISEELGDKQGIALSLHQLGIIQQLQGNYEEAKKLYEESLKISEELGDKRGIASSLHGLGIIQQHQGNYEEAKKLYEESLKIKKELSDKEGISKILHQLGIIQQHQGNYEEAKKLYEESLKIKKELSDKQGIASSLGQLGRLYQERREYKKAVEAYLAAASLFHRLKSPYETLALQGLANIEKKIGKKKFNEYLKKIRER